MKSIYKILLAIAVLGVVAGVVVSCNKESAKDQETHATKDPIVEPSEEECLEKLTKDIFYCWLQCDDAYRTDSVSFLAMCNMEDFEDFCTYLDFSDRFIDRIDSLAHEEIPHALLELGSAVNNMSACQECQMGSIAACGQRVSALSRMMDNLSGVGVIEPEPDFMTLMDSCVVLCTYLNHDYTLPEVFLCLINCNLSKAYDQALQTFMAITNPQE
ncbi:MAG: hypothetical protein IK058_00735 [Bacteroidales bacterium]|nr:hypothetical protein [Bacteroidales bacterium]